MKDSQDRWITNRYPLIKAGMSHRDWLEWWREVTTVPKNAQPYVACPFQSCRRWVATKHRWPELFTESVEIDARLRSGLALDKTPYLHRQRMTLAEAVALDEAGLEPGELPYAFANEC